MQLTQWWFTYQSTLPRYIFENVPPLGDTKKKVLENGDYIHQLLGRPIFVNAPALSS